MGRTFVSAAVVGVCCASLVAACSDQVRLRRGGEGGDGSGSGGVGTAGAEDVGKPCSASKPCREGLTCGPREVCEADEKKGRGEACVVAAECDEGQCVQRQCATAGVGVAGDGCEGDGDCASGLRCDLVGLGLACVAQGPGDVGATCQRNSQCLAGLSCLAGNCSSSPDGKIVYGGPWKGVDCDEPVETGVKAYFEVPGAAGADEGDFFRLPFPTDVRRHHGQLELSGFPTPGDEPLGVDVIQRYVDAISDNDSGWSAYPTVIFRFSGPIAYETLATDAVQFVDVTEPQAGRSIGWQRFYTDARTNYVCENFVAVQPPSGRALEPGHTYAVFILSEASGVTLLEEGGGACTPDGSDGSDTCPPVTRSANLDAVMGSEPPADGALNAAHVAFAPLRAYLEAENLPADNVLTASVFTVGPVRNPMAQLAEAVATSPPPVASAWVECGSGRPSPCPQAERDRSCSEDPYGYDEYHALLGLPVFQQGTAPYLTPDDGGAIDVARPRNEAVCLSITVPEGEPPATGWPTIVFAHGTGGSFRSHARAEVAGALSAAAPRFAVLGIDQVGHGPRRGASTESPHHLFFNFLNPAAARGNPLQAAADQLSLARFAQTLAVDAATTLGSAIKLDPAQLHFFGHSQGSTAGSLMLPFGDAYGAAVLSGNGASLRDTLRTKLRPHNVAAALPIVLRDPLMTHPGIGRAVTSFHPVLSLLQHWVDPVDPITFAEAIGSPLAGHTGKHLFQPFGIADSFSPPDTLATFVLAAGLKQVTPHSSADPPYRDFFEDVSALDPLPLGYRAVGSGITRGMRQYGAANGDGHFVVFEQPAANDDMVLFFTTATGTTSPVIGRQ